MSKVLAVALAALACGGAIALAVSQVEANNASIMAGAEPDRPILITAAQPR